MAAHVSTADALRAAIAEGGAIRLAPGEYAGPFTINGTVELVGEPGAVLTGGRANRTLSIVAGADATLDGLDIRATEHAWMAVSIDAAARARLVRCTITGGDGAGGQPTGILSWGDLHVEACRISGGPGSQGATAISTYGRSLIVDNDLDANHIGVNCHSATIEKNRIRAGTYGVYIQGDDVIVRNNQITLSPDRNVRAVFVVRGERLAVESNTITGGPDESRWANLPARSWLYDDSGRDYSEITITPNGLWYHGEASGPSGGPYTGPTQNFDDFLAHDPVQQIPTDLLDEIRAYLRAHLGTST